MVSGTFRRLRTHCNSCIFSSIPPTPQIVKIVLLVCAIGSCAAQKSCPSDASGVYPRCVCKDFNFIFSGDACVKVNRDVCPEPAFKTENGCRCPNPKDFFDDYYWLCRTKLYLPTVAPVVPITPPIYTACPAYTRGEWPNCERIPCGNRKGSFEPNCAIETVTVEPVVEKRCPAGEVGTPPYCAAPCPQYQSREYQINASSEPHNEWKWKMLIVRFLGRIRFANGTSVHPDSVRHLDPKEYQFVCEPIPCPKMRGWAGDIMPHCVFTPFCPDEFPGNYPFCNRYATSSLSSQSRNNFNDNNEIDADPKGFDYRFNL